MQIKSFSRNNCLYLSFNLEWKRRKLKAKEVVKESPGNYSSVHMCTAAIQDKNESDMLNATQLDEFLLSSTHKEKKLNQKLISLSF